LISKPTTRAKAWVADFFTFASVMKNMLFIMLGGAEAGARSGEQGTLIFPSVFIREAVRGQSILICGEVSWAKYPSMGISRFREWPLLCSRFLSYCTKDEF